MHRLKPKLYPSRQRWVLISTDVPSRFARPLSLTRSLAHSLTRSLATRFARCSFARWSVPADAGSGSKGSAPVVLKDGSGLSEAGIRDGSTLIFKDLGPQIGYQTVFFWEYLGPLVIYALVYLLPASFVYPASALVSPALSASSWFSRALPSSASSGRSLTQTLACVYWCFHYAKRIYETFHVHRWVD